MYARGPILLLSHSTWQKTVCMQEDPSYCCCIQLGRRQYVCKRTHLIVVAFNLAEDSMYARGPILLLLHSTWQKTVCMQEDPSYCCCIQLGRRQYVCKRTHLIVVAFNLAEDSMYARGPILLLLHSTWQKTVCMQEDPSYCCRIQLGRRQYVCKRTHLIVVAFNLAEDSMYARGPILLLLHSTWQKTVCMQEDPSYCCCIQLGRRQYVCKRTHLIVVAFNLAEDSMYARGPILLLLHSTWQKTVCMQEDPSYCCCIQLGRRQYVCKRTHLIVVAFNLAEDSMYARGPILLLLHLTWKKTVCM